MVHGTRCGAVGRRRTKTTEQVAEIAQEDWLPLGPVAAWPTVSAASPRESRRGQRQRQKAEGRGQRADAGKRTRRKWTRLGLGGATGDARPRARRRGGESRPSAQGSPHLSAPLSAAQRRSAAASRSLARRVPACPSVCQRVPACASGCQHVPAGPSSECRRFRREPVCASSPRPRIKAAGLAKSQAKGQDSRHSPKSRPLRAGCNKSLASPEAARAAYNMLRCLCSPLPLPLLLSSPSPPPPPAEVV
jgi:hypothetical protein